MICDLEVTWGCRDLRYRQNVSQLIYHGNTKNVFYRNPNFAIEEVSSWIHNLIKHDLHYTTTEEELVEFMLNDLELKKIIFCISDETKRKEIEALVNLGTFSRVIPSKTTLLKSCDLLSGHVYNLFLSQWK